MSSTTPPEPARAGPSTSSRAAARPARSRPSRPAAAVARPSSPAAPSSAWPLVGGAALGRLVVLRHRRPAGRGAARLDPRLRQHRPRPERRAEDRGASGCCKKFPAFKDEIGLDTDDDIRERIFDRSSWTRRLRRPRLRRRHRAVARRPRRGGRGRHRRGQPDAGRRGPGQRRGRGRGRPGQARATCGGEGERRRRLGRSTATGR